MSEKTAIIHVRGGVVQQVYSDDPSLEIKICDWDEQDEKDQEKNKELEAESLEMSLVY